MTAGSDLYVELGISRDATDKDVHRAYRRASKSAHPDMPGGSQEKFAALTLAHDVLSDPERRRRYDETGEVSPTMADSLQADALNILMQLLQKAIVGVLQQKRQPKQVDLVGLVRNDLAWQITEAGKADLEAAKQIEIIEDLIPRFKAKEGKPNWFATMLRGQINDIHASQQNCERRLRTLRHAETLLDGLSFDPEIVPTPVYYQGWDFVQPGPNATFFRFR